MMTTKVDKITAAAAALQNSADHFAEAADRIGEALEALAGLAKDGPGAVNQNQAAAAWRKARISFSAIANAIEIITPLFPNPQPWYDEMIEIRRPFYDGRDLEVGNSGD